MPRGHIKIRVGQCEITAAPANDADEPRNWQYNFQIKHIECEDEMEFSVKDLTDLIQALKHAMMCARTQTRV